MYDVGKQVTQLVNCTFWCSFYIFINGQYMAAILKPDCKGEVQNIRNHQALSGIMYIEVIRSSESRLSQISCQSINCT